MTYKRGGKDFYVPKRHNPKGLDPTVTAQRILARSFVRDTGRPERTFVCHVCRDVGWIELEPGSKAQMQSGATVTVSDEGPGTWRRCDGPMAGGCRYRREQAERAAARAAMDGKLTSGEAASL